MMIVNSVLKVQSTEMKSIENKLNSYQTENINLQIGGMLSQFQKKYEDIIKQLYSNENCKPNIEGQSTKEKYNYVIKKLCENYELVEKCLKFTENDWKQFRKDNEKSIKNKKICKKLTEYKKIGDLTKTIEFLTEYMQTVIQEINKIPDNADVLLFFGKIRSGKSYIINLLNGEKYKQTKENCSIFKNTQNEDYFNKKNNVLKKIVDFSSDNASKANNFLIEPYNFIISIGQFSYGQLKGQYFIEISYDILNSFNSIYLKKLYTSINCINLFFTNYLIKNIKNLKFILVLSELITNTHISKIFHDELNLMYISMIKDKLALRQLNIINNIESEDFEQQKKFLYEKNPMFNYENTIILKSLNNLSESNKKKNIDDLLEQILKTRVLTNVLEQYGKIEESGKSFYTFDEGQIKHCYNTLKKNYYIRFRENSCNLNEINLKENLRSCRELFDASCNFIKYVDNNFQHCKFRTHYYYCIGEIIENIEKEVEKRIIIEETIEKVKKISYRRS